MDIDTSVATIEESEVETDEEETPNLARVRKLVAKANQGAVADGEIEPVHKIIKDGDCRVAAAEQVPQLTVQDVMPQGERDQVDQNPNLPVHSGEGMIDFVLVKENHARTANGKAKGMSLPKEDEFCSIVNNAIVNMVTINMGWCNVVERSGVTKAGLGLMKLNYGYPDGVAVFRDSIYGQSTNDITYKTYPAADLIKKYGISVFIHQGYKGIPNHLLGGGLKGGNADMVGDFEVVDSRTLRQEGKEDCRLLSLDLSLIHI